MKTIPNIQISFLMADADHGGGGEDPYERDRVLAANFKLAVLRQQDMPSSTDNAYGLKDKATDILQRAEEVSPFLWRLEPSLTRIAKKLQSDKFKCLSDRQNPAAISYVFENFDW